MVVVRLLCSMFENFFYDATAGACIKLCEKRQQKKFIKKMNSEIENFCKLNECLYINSDEFVRFIKCYKPLERIMENSIALGDAVSIEAIINILITEAKCSAEKEGKILAHDDIRIIKDLCKMIDKNISYYFNEKITSEQRYAITETIKATGQFKDELENINENIDSVKKIINNSMELSDYKAESIVTLICEKMWTGQYSEIEELIDIVMQKSHDVELAIQVMKAQMFNGKKSLDYQIRDLSQIKNIVIRDCVIRNIIPLLYYRNIKVDKLVDLVTSETLKKLLKSIGQEDYSFLFPRKIEDENGIETHIYTLNKEMELAEEWLLKQIFAIYLYNLKTINTVKIIESMVDVLNSWFSLLIVYDRKIDLLQFENFSSNEIGKFVEIEEKLLGEKDKMKILANDIQELYFSMLLKVSLCAGDKKYVEIEKEIPAELGESKLIKDFSIACRIENREIEFDELYMYCKKYSEYWLITNYIIKIEDSKKAVELIEKYIELIDYAPDLFLIYAQCLKYLGRLEELKNLLISKKNDNCEYYEYWEILLQIDNSDDTINEFLERCRINSIVFINRQSRYAVVEQLIKLKSYELAENNVNRLIAQNGNKALIKKYKAFILLGKNKSIDALELFKAAYAEDEKDIQSLDYIITLSIKLKRIIDSKYIEAAIQQNSKRMYFLVAIAYESIGNYVDAKRNNIRSLLASEDINNPAYSQFLNLNLHNEENEIIIKSVDKDTAVYLKSEDDEAQKIFCVYSDKLLPTCPFIWNDATHFYIEDAAKIGLLKKKVDDVVEIDEKKYTIIEIQSINSFFARVCFRNLTRSGVAKTIVTPVEDGKMNVESFVEQIKEFTPDEKDRKNWIEQYKNFNELAFPLYYLHKFCNCSYSQFVEIIINSKDIPIRELLCESNQTTDKYILSFSALLLLKRLGITYDFINGSNAFISESTKIQINVDADSMIERYTQEDVISMQIYDGMPLINEASDEEKSKWLVYAGDLKNYANNLRTVLNTSDIQSSVWEDSEIIEVIGIPDYDAISLGINENYTIISLEAMMSSMSTIQDIKVNTISVIDWLIASKMNVIDLIRITHEMMLLGCIYSITDKLIIYIMEQFEKAEDIEKNEILSKFDSLLQTIENIDIGQKPYAIQMLNIVFQKLNPQIDNFDIHPIFRRIMYKLLMLNNIKIGIDKNEHGELEVVAYRMCNKEDGDE